MQRISRVLALGCGVALSAMAMAQPCVPPRTVRVTPSDRCGSIQVSLWVSSQSSVTSYRLFRRIGIDATPQLVADFGQSLPSSWSDTTAPGGAAIYYQLEAWVDTCVTRSDWTHIQRAAVTPPPLDFAASDLTVCELVKLTWVNRSPCGTNTRVYRAEYPEFAAAVPIPYYSELGGYIDPGVEVNMPYFYWATNTSSLGESVVVGPVLGRANPNSAPSFLIRNPHRHAVPTTRYNLDLDIAVGSGVVREYQWFKDDVALSDDAHIAGSQTSVLTLVGCEFSDAGDYRLRATNACGTSTSDPIRVDVGLDGCFGWCRPDTNADGGTDGQDIQYFLELWVNGEPCADWNLDGGIDGSDLLEYMDAWQLWCC